MKAYDEMMGFLRETEALAQVAGRLGWDQEAVMPHGAAAQRAEEVGALEHVLHARRTDKRIGAWLAVIEPGGLDAMGQAVLRHVARDYARTQKVPAKLAGELARLSSLGHRIWAGARAERDFQAFRPTLEQIVALKREEGAALADGGDVYDALLDGFEPGASGARLQAMFDTMRPRLVALRDRVLGASYQPPALEGSFDAASQIGLARKLAAAFGYDFEHGRLDQAVHPFSSGSGLDVRITTRTSADDPFNCIYSTIHETGHAAYEQGIDRAYLLTPLGQGVSMGVHESQSRIYENQIGRGAAFTGWLHGEMEAAFGALSVGRSDFYGAVNKLHKGYIRTEADEVQYNLHIMLRFDLERQMIAGDLAPADLEEAWNARFAADFGYEVDHAANGCLQDVHWSAGLFGYFPTYSLGNVYAGCLNEAMRADLPDLDAALARGDTSPATGWLREKLQRHGGLREPEATITHATGREPDAGPLLDYLEAKFGEIYRL